MTTTEARQYLIKLNEWRRGADTPQLDVTQIGIAIDVMVNETYSTEEILEAAKTGEVSMIDAQHICTLLTEIRK